MFISDHMKMGFLMAVMDIIGGLLVLHIKEFLNEMKNGKGKWKK